jgi:hypothetical protein
MSPAISRRHFSTLTAGLVFGTTIDRAAADEKPAAATPANASGPTQAPFERDYAPPGFKPGWKKPQLNHLLVQDFVVFAHTDLPMVKRLVEKEPAVLNAAIDWGNGDWETGLGGASHMGRRDIVEFLLDKGARIDIFCAAMLGQLDAVRSFLALQPKLIDAPGPHRLSLHFHAQVGGKEAEQVLDYLQSVKKVTLKPIPFLKQPDPPAPKP